MNIANVNTSANRGVQGRNNGRNTPVWKKGQILEGLITKVSSQISINFNDREVNVSPSAVRNAREGDLRKFEIMEVSKRSIVLKEVGSNTLGSGTIQMAVTQVDAGQTAFSDQMAQAVREKRKGDITNASQEHLKHSANGMTEEDYKDITDADISIEEYTAAQLDMALERVKEQREFDRSMLEQHVDHQSETEEQIVQIGESQSAESGLSKEISERLKKANVPVTEENIQALIEALKLFESSANMKPNSYRYMMENNMVASAQNIYKAAYAGQMSEKLPVPDDIWGKLIPQVEDLITRSGLKVTENSMQDAKWFLDNEMPLTEESLHRLESLREVINNMTPEQAMERIIEGMRSGQQPRRVNLELDQEVIAKKFIEDLKTITDAAVAKTVSRLSGDVTMAKLREAQQEINVAAPVISEDFHLPDNTNIAMIQTRRQLEEIRLKMTADSAVRMLGKGIEIDVTALSELVDELREMENAYYRNYYKDTDLSEADLSMLTNTKDFIQELKTSPNFVLGSTLAQRKTITIQELHTEGNVMKAKLDKANTAYDTLKTEPRRDLGDSMKKAFRSIDHILENTNLEVTEANRRAVRILGYNHMEITEQSVAQVKAYDAQVNNLMQNLRPAVTLQLIKDGINPLNTPIEQLNENISGIKQELNMPQEEQYAKFLWKVQKQSGITSEERKEFIGIYRLLNNVEKTDGAAIGSLIQTEQEITLNNLMRAVKTMKYLNSRGSDRITGEKSGGLESLTFQTESTSEQLADDLSRQGQESGGEEAEYQQRLLENIMDSVSPAKLKSLESKEKIMNSSLEWLKEQFDVEMEDPAEDAYAKEQIKALKELALNSESALRFLRDFDMPDTIGNIMRANQFLSSTGNPMKALGLKLKGSTDQDNSDEEKEEVREAIRGFAEALTDNETMLEQYDKLDRTVKQILKPEYGDNHITAEGLAALKSLTGGITFARNMARKECYEIPVAVGDSITNIHLTVIHNGEGKGKLNITVDSDQLGHMTGDFQVTKGNMKGSVLADSPKGMDQMKANIHLFEQECEESGLSLQQIHFGTMQGIRSSYVSQKGNQTGQQDEVNTKQLYRAAKAFVRLVKQAEE